MRALAAIDFVPDGAPGEPEAFALAAPGRDRREAWNRAHDGGSV